MTSPVVFQNLTFIRIVLDIVSLHVDFLMYFFFFMRKAPAGLDDITNFQIFRIECRGGKAKAPAFTPTTTPPTRSVVMVIPRLHEVFRWDNMIITVACTQVNNKKDNNLSKTIRCARSTHQTFITASNNYVSLPVRLILTRRVYRKCERPRVTHV